MSRDKVIEFSGVAKSYGSRRVLKGFDLTVFRGNVYALLGENGEGKTTAIKMAAGQMEPDAGAVRYSVSTRSVTECGSGNVLPMSPN